MVVAVRGDWLGVVTEMGELRDADRCRERVLKAAVVELAANRLDGFTVEKVSARAGVDELAVKQMWPNAPELITAALVAFGQRYGPLPETGSLHGDLLHFARLYADFMNSALGRRLLDAVIVSPRDWDVAGSRAGYVNGRNDQAIAIVSRAVERGECAPGTDPVRVSDLLGAGLCLPVLLYDRPISDEDCEFVVGTVLNGIVAREDDHLG